MNRHAPKRHAGLEGVHRKLRPLQAKIGDTAAGYDNRKSREVQITIVSIKVTVL
jgi:hypothetical protein